jgi:spore coat polysaccharide biosynthesis protein SpsF
MGSRRLPGKVLKKIGNNSLLGHLMTKVNSLKNKVNVVIATSTLEINNEIEEFCLKNNIRCFRGSESNVLERYYFCAKEYGFDHIVRLTGDNPFVDDEEIDNLVKLHIKKNADYSQSYSALPVGVGAEIFSFETLEKSFKYGVNENHKEHVNEYIEENEDKFKIIKLSVPKEKNRPDISLTIDTVEDLNKASFIFDKAKENFISTEEAISLCLRYL